MRYLPAELRLPGRCQGCGTPVSYDGKRWREAEGRGRGKAHACPEERPTCGAWMPQARERCARGPAHRDCHKTRYAMDCDLFRQTGHFGRKRAA